MTRGLDLEGAERLDAAQSLSLRGVGRSFGDKPVLSDVNLDVAAGQFVAIVGRSGCGKSTLLRIIAGLDRPSEGSVAFAPQGQSTRIRLMFQEPRLLPWLSVLDNVLVGLGETDASPAQRAAAQEVLADVGLPDRSGDWPTQLSGGQKQRVALARALVSRPTVLALDEPLGALDALTRIEMQMLIERVFASSGFTALLVTHDVSEAVALADRIVVLEHGRVGLDLPVDLPRGARRGSHRANDLEKLILSRLLSETAPNASRSDA